jgi:protein-tyrosine phosphatase
VVLYNKYRKENITPVSIFHSLFLDGLIGVHCTHGVNRTGYLICRYLIERLQWTPEDALISR